jgi:CRP-like cAMP-binding protein
LNAGFLAEMPMDLHTERRSRAPRPSTVALSEPPERRAMRLLRPLPLFDGVSLDDERSFVGAAVRACHAGTVLFTAGEPADVLYVTIHGRVRLVLGAEPGGRSLGVMGRGDTIGLAALLRGDLYPVTAVVLDDAMLVALPADTVQRLLAEQPAIAVRLVGDMSAKLARFVRDIGGFNQRTARARVARLLSDLHRDAESAVEDLGFGEPKRVIAARLAMTPETLSRELHALAVAGLIESRRTRFRVLDPGALERLADDAASVAGLR